MAGLSSGYISSKLAAEGISTVTEDAILRFINFAENAADIAGTEPELGPVHDDPSEGYGDQTRDYDIGIKVAERIIKRRDTFDFFGGLTNMTQLAGIPYFGADKFNDLLYSFHQTVYEISSIEFNIASGSISNDALNIRNNFSNATPSPSWLKGSTSTFEDSPVAYTIKETQGQTLAITVELRASGIGGAFVRAIGGGRLGPVKEQFVAFSGTGAATSTTFQLENPTFHSDGVGVHNISWRWQWRRHPTDSWRDIVRTRHRLFVTLEAPTLPWVQTPGSTSLPWVDALEIACRWARGATDKDTAAGLITERFNGSDRVSYETNDG
ncbi:MAG: hypothetical protein ACR2QF_11140, partial [Geminicoccaceae bacterium]